MKGRVFQSEEQILAVITESSGEYYQAQMVGIPINFTG
jgi:hypothetical protein